MERKEYIIHLPGYQTDFGQRGNVIGWKHSCKEIIEVHPGAGSVSRQLRAGQVAEHVFTRYVT